MKTPRTTSSLSLFTTTATAVAIGFVAIPASPASAALGDCPSGYMCLWSQTNYTGTVQKVSTTSSYRAVTLSSVESYYNNRTQRTWLHEKADGSGDYLCLSPGARKASGLSGWQDNPKAVWLATVTNC